MAADMARGSYLLCVAFALCVAAAAASAPKCPNPTDIQTDYVKKSFDVKKFQGVW